MRQQLDSKLNDVRDLVMKMGAVVEEEIKTVILALKTQDEKLLKKVYELERRSDELEHEIEEKCIHLIALQQPIAKDLRMISATLKIITDLERIGDHGVNIAEVVERLCGQAYIKPLVDLPKMADQVVEMIRGSLDTFTREDLEGAKTIAGIDDTVDALYEKIYRELLGMLAEDKAIMNQVVDLLFVGRFIERIADHATNICEATIYYVAGERIEF